ncbi:hypothetical protein V9L05_17680 [Bernardetia sp. Wsw4-3y2]|uniref:hypothetical protein n=1 Tax=Bernardetia sp. Wsw4-3y2 TaxID=3127471 RepID=UPI0030CFF9BA
MGKKTYNNNTNVITKSNGNRNIHQVQNNYSKKENKENHFSLFEAFRLIEELKTEVAQLKEQIKNQPS